jgi:hypothetical protein
MVPLVAAHEVEPDRDLLDVAASNRRLRRGGQHQTKRVQNVVARLLPVATGADRPGQGRDRGGRPTLLGPLVHDRELHWI